MADFADPQESGLLGPQHTPQHDWYTQGYTPTITAGYTPTVTGHPFTEEDQPMDDPYSENIVFHQPGPAAQPDGRQDIIQPPPIPPFPPSPPGDVRGPAAPLSDLVEVLDGRGDLILVVGPEKREYMVCSRTLRRASAVFDRLYDQRFQGHDGHMRINLTHIGTTPMHLILLVIHGAPMKVQERMGDPNTLHDVLVVTHHFEMTKCLAPIALKWLRRTYNKEPAQFRDIAVQMWITYQMGHLSCLKQTIYNMVISGRINARGYMVGPQAGENDEYRRFPTLELIGILDKVQDCRARVIATLVTLVQESVTRLTESPRHPTVTSINGPQPKPTVCQLRGEAPTRKRQCDCRILGALHRALYAVNWGKVNYHAMSPQSLHKRITDISRQTLKEYEPPTDQHRHCEPFGGKLVELMEIVNAEVEKIQFDEQDFHRRGTEMGFGKSTT